MFTHRRRDSAPICFSGEMAPPTDPDTDKAVTMVCHANICNALFAMTVPFIPLRVCQVGNGCDPRTAWEACGQPKGKPGLQNIRKRGYKLRREHEAIEEAAQALHADVTTPEQADAPVQAEAEGWGRGVPKRGYRLRKEQVQAEQLLREQRRAQFDELYKKATLEWQLMVAEGRNGKGDNRNCLCACMRGDLRVLDKMPRIPVCRLAYMLALCLLRA